MSEVTHAALSAVLDTAGIDAVVDARGRVALVRVARAADVARCAVPDVRDALLAAARADGAATCAVTCAADGPPTTTQ